MIKVNQRTEVERLAVVSYKVMCSEGKVVFFNGENLEWSQRTP